MTSATRHWGDLGRDAPAAAPQDAPVPLCRLHAARVRARRDRLLLILGTCRTLLLALGLG